MYDGCAYLSGYVVELALKACVCKSLGVNEYPENEPGLKQLFRTHDFNALELLAGLRSSVAEKRKASLQFDNNWALAISWKPEDRYALKLRNENDARAILESIRETPEGVLTWLEQQW